MNVIWMGLLSVIFLRPGVKLQLRGQMVCRLGVLLLGPSNVKVLGGEVEELVDRNNQVKLQVSLVCQIWFMFVFVAVFNFLPLTQDRVLCRTLGLPEEEQQPEEREENPPAPQQGIFMTSSVTMYYKGQTRNVYIKTICKGLV